MGVTAEVGNVGASGLTLAEAPVYGANFVRGLGSATSITGAANVLGLLFRRGRNVVATSGMQFEIQLDSPLTINTPGQPAPAGQAAPPPPPKPESGF